MKDSLNIINSLLRVADGANLQVPIGEQHPEPEWCHSCF
jgi:hypothetical protein